MTDSIQDLDQRSPLASSRGELGEINAWLDSSASLATASELPILLSHLATLRALQIAPQQRALILDRLFCRGLTILNTVRPALTEVSLPLPRNVRLLVRQLQDMLRSLTEDLLSTPNITDAHLIRGLRDTQARLLRNCVYALSQHLLISNLVAAPPKAGVWPLLHKTYAIARFLKVAQITPEGSPNTLRTLYQSALLLGCAQPASFTSREVAFVAEYAERHADQIELTQEFPQRLADSFWVDSTQDAAAFACARRTPPDDRAVDYFSCKRLTELLKSQIRAIESGRSPQEIKLPDFAGSAAGRGVLRRLLAHWGDQDKRRFPRRRQSYRALLCAGLDSLWRLFHSDDETSVETSTWMITNESPDGYAVMHVSGKPGRMSVGDVTAIRTESGTNWKICIIRWAVSESTVHLELGLQILASNAVPAFLVQPGAPDAAKHLSVLVLPEVPAIRAAEMMIVPSGSLEECAHSHVLVFEKDNIAIREVRSTGVDEQNSQIEVFSIIPETMGDAESP